MILRDKHRARWFCGAALTRLMLGYIEDLPVESLVDLAPMTQLQHLELSVRARIL